MPAIQLTRLKTQAAAIAAHFHHPPFFIRELAHLLEFYADRTHRPGLAGAPPPLIPAHNVPQPVLRRVLFELSPHVAADPQAALHLADALWAQYFIEFRLIAASILGMLTPLSPQDPLPRIQEWRAASDEDLLLDALAGDSLARYRQHNTPEFLTALSGWLGSSEIPDINFGLRALHAMLQSATYTNLPAIYRIIAPLFQNTAKVLRPFLLDILLLLAKQAPQETAFFLLQLLNKDKNPAAIWLVRHSLDAFPQKHQTNLRAALRG